MGIDLEDKTIECPDIEEELEIREKSNQFIGRTILELADSLPAYFSKKFISVLAKKGISVNSHYSELSLNQSILLDEIYGKCEDIIIKSEAKREQIYLQ